MILTSVIAAMIQAYFTYRTFVLTKSWLVSSSIGILCFVSLSTGLGMSGYICVADPNQRTACGIQTFRLVQFENFLKFRVGPLAVELHLLQITLANSGLLVFGWVAVPLVTSLLRVHSAGLCGLRRRDSGRKWCQ